MEEVLIDREWGDGLCFLKTKIYVKDGFKAPSLIKDYDVASWWGCAHYRS